MPDKRRLECDCGNETYYIMWDAEGQVWAECEECGRPSSTVGVGREKQVAWMNQQ